MKTIFDFSKVKVSWTKYDVVHLVDLVANFDIFKKYYSKQAIIDEPILRSFACVRSLSENIPAFWNDFFLMHDDERKQFACFWALFTSYDIATSFAQNYMTGPLKGKFEVVGKNKVYTNLRSLFVESLVAPASSRREKIVEFDCSSLLNSPEAGRTFKKALDTYLRKNAEDYDDSEFYEVCEKNQFHRVLGMQFEDFKEWLDACQKEGTSIRAIGFDKFLCLDTPCQLDFGDSKEIYFVGENGDGKTVMLMALFMAFMGAVTKNDVSKSLALPPIREIESEMKDAQLSGYDNFDRKYGLNSAPRFKNFFAYGTHRGRYSVETDKDTYERYGFMTLFNNDMTLHDPTDWLKKRLFMSSSHDDLSFNNLSRVLSELLEEKVSIENEGPDIFYKERGYKLTLKELSEGYRSTIIFVCDLLSKLSEKCPCGDSVFKQPGVVLIDEICLHLHPRWQKTIVKKLRSLFENIQFIMTTHSPVIVLGASKDAVFYRISRENGITSVSDPYYRKNMDDWMLNTLITSSLFGLESAAMDNSNPFKVDTNDNYLMSRIMKRVDDKLSEQRSQGHRYFSDSELDEIINSILDNE